MKLKFEIEIPEEPIFLAVDRLQVSRVITNLINNALKHNEPGTTIGLQLCHAEPNSKNGQKENQEMPLQIIVSDNGAMIDPIIAEHIFEPFVMADASRESKGGSGLGLSIAKKIVEMHGWSIALNQDFERQEKSFVINMNHRGKEE